MATRPTGDLIVEVTGLRRAFGDTTVLDGADLTVRRGEVVALLGGSGSGKSTLLRALAGLDADATGHITVPAHYGVVFQEHRLLPWKRVADNVVLVLEGGRIAEEIPVGLPKPRHQDDPGFGGLRRHLLDRLGVPVV
jgi:sulfonate transport system ATP-binding protein